MTDSRRIDSISDVCVADYRPGTSTDAGAPPDLLIEVPHGATLRAHFEELRGRLRGVFPDDLEAFFFVNTDIGAPECAERIAERVTRERPSWNVLILRCLVPRTFIDTNRIVEEDPAGRPGTGMTPVLPGYVTDPADIELLTGRHRSYQRAADAAYDAVCGSGGTALILHTYAPRSVDIENIDAGIVPALREAYRPEQYARWSPRPDVDLITEDADGTGLAHAELAEQLVRSYAAIGVEVAKNDTYRLHRGTGGWVRSIAWPGQVLCMEINRARLADPFDPFVAMRIGPEKVAEMSEPVVEALLFGLGRAPR